MGDHHKSDKEKRKRKYAEQQAKQAEYELQKAKVENERKIAEAEANAKVMEVQNASTTENALKLKKLEIQKAFIEKWDGKLPSTALGDNIPVISNIGD